MHNKSYRIGPFYRPSAQIQELNVEIIMKIEASCHNKERDMVIMENFNFPEIEWDSLISMNHRSSFCIKCMVVNFLSQVVQGISVRSFIKVTQMKYLNTI